MMKIVHFYLLAILRIPRKKWKKGQFSVWKKSSSVFLHSIAIIIVIVITFYSPTYLGQETAKVPFGLQNKLTSAHRTATHGGGFTLSL